MSPLLSVDVDVETVGCAGGAEVGGGVVMVAVSDGGGELCEGVSELLLCGGGVDEGVGVGVWEGDASVAEADVCCAGLLCAGDAAASDVGVVTPVSVALVAVSELPEAESELAPASGSRGRARAIGGAGCEWPRRSWRGAMKRTRTHVRNARRARLRAGVKSLSIELAAERLKGVS